MSARVKNAVASVVTSGMASVGPGTGLAGQRILIVEDNPFVARQCERVLTDAGCKVLDIVTTADEAVRVALKRRPRLILMDIYLPGKRDGVDAAIEILERCGIRSIFASAPADSTAKTRAETARPLAWLPKPFSDNKLLATIELAIANAETCPSLVLKSGTRDRKNSINIGPKQSTPSGQKGEYLEARAEIAALRNPPPPLSALASAIEFCPPLEKRLAAASPTD